jgi:proteasome accessory factor A
VLDLLEIDQLPNVGLEDAVEALRVLSHRPDGPWTVASETGESLSAIEALGFFYEASASAFAGRDDETDWILAQWKDVLSKLEGNPVDLVGRIDWITKRWLLQAFAASEGLPFSDPWIRSQDLEYHNIDPEKGLGLSAERNPTLKDVWSDGWEATDLSPPPNTRAHLRVRMMRGAAKHFDEYAVDWEGIQVGDRVPLALLDPYQSESATANEWLDRLPDPDRAMTSIAGYIES